MVRNGDRLIGNVHPGGIVLPGLQNNPYLQINHRENHHSFHSWKGFRKGCHSWSWWGREQG